MGRCARQNTGQISVRAHNTFPLNKRLNPQDLWVAAPKDHSCMHDRRALLATFAQAKMWSAVKSRVAVEGSNEVLWWGF
jgi:hypothetical protein